MIKLVRELSSELPGFGLDDGVWSDPVADAIMSISFTPTHSFVLNTSVFLLLFLYLAQKPGRRRREMNNKKKANKKIK